MTSNWLRREEAAAYSDRCTEWIDIQRKLGRLRARKVMRWVESHNGHAFIKYRKKVWVIDPESLETAQKFKRPVGRKPREKRKKVLQNPAEV